DRGRILVELKKDKRAQAVMIISDTGKGIPQEDLDRIFEPGYTTKEKGLGLGLAIAREIIKAHGGDIKVWSRLGKGTTFYVTLPVKE
ncbi:MAG: ATP-binding protein, partial [Desulfatiglandales bacterium]